MADELEKMQRALNQSYADRDRMASDLDKVRDDLERSQVCKNQGLLSQVGQSHDQGERAIIE